MNPIDQVTTALTTWLQSPDALPVLRTMIYRELEKQMTDGSLAHAVSRRFGDDSQACREDMLQEFVLFLHQHTLPELPQHPDMVNALLQGQTHLVLKYALRRFFWRLRDKARTKDENTRAYLHRRLREAVTGDNRFVVRTISSHHCFLPITAESADTTASFGDQHFSDWPPPEDPGENRNTLFTLQYLGDVAESFSTLALKKYRIHGWIPVRAVCAYLAEKYPWLNSYRPVPLSETDDQPSAAKNPEQETDRLTALESIHALAAQFSDGLDDTARKIFSWRMEDPPVSFQDIAVRLALPDHNRVYRMHDKTLKAMKRFVRNWPGPPLEELDEEVGLAFIENVRKICKNTAGRP